MALRQVVINRNLMPRIEKFLNAHGPDVARPAGDKHIHGGKLSQPAASSKFQSWRWNYFRQISSNLVTPCPPCRNKFLRNPEAIHCGSAAPAFERNVLIALMANCTATADNSKPMMRTARFMAIGFSQRAPRAEVRKIK